MRKADFVEWDKGQGRVERRAVWVVEAGELGPHLEGELRWPGVRQVGWIRRSRRSIHAVGWQQDKLSTWVSRLEGAKAGPKEIAEGLRGHLAIENGVHLLRDVTMDENRLHGRLIGRVLAAVRNTAINLIRRLGYDYIPDGQRELSARPQHGLTLLTHLPER